VNVVYQGPISWVDVSPKRPITDLRMRSLDGQLSECEQRTGDSLNGQFGDLAYAS
jgi:hypothetical protein